MEISNEQPFNKKTYYAEYYKNNKDKILNNLKQPLTCDICNSKYCKSSYYRHIESRKHKYAVLLQKQN